MNEKLSSILLILLLVVVGLSGDFCFKRSGGCDRWMLGGFLFYLSAGIPVWLAYRRTAWIEISILREMLFLVGALFIGRFVWGEVLDIRKLLAAVLSVAAILVLYF